MKRESAVLKLAMLEHSRMGDVVFRNHVGMGVFGSMRRIPGTGDVVVENARVAMCGLFEGSADLIGWRTVTVTPEMVGQKVAVFLSVEVKTATGRLSARQKDWAENVRRAGGVSVVYRGDK